MLRENRDTECNSLTINGKSKGKSATGFDVLAPETTNQLTLMTNILLLLPSFSQYHVEAAL